MTNTEKLIEAGDSLIVYPNRLGTVTMVRIKSDQWEPFQDFIEVISEDQIIDILFATPEAIEEGAAKLGRKERREGEYADWDEKMQKLGLSHPPQQRPKN